MLPILYAAREVPSAERTVSYCSSPLVLPSRRGFAKQSADPGARTTASEAATVREHTGSTR